jgi:cytochrome P450
MATLDLDALFAPDVIADPYPLFARLREEDPVHWNAAYQLWVVTRYDDVVWMVRNHEAFSSAVIRTDERPPYPPVDAADLPLLHGVREFRGDQLVEQDRPVHAAMRQVVHEFFTPGAMEAWRPFVRTAVADCLDEVQALGRMDVHRDLAAPLPVRVIAHMMGVPERDRDHLRGLADKLLYINRGESYRLRPLTEGIQGMIDYVSPLVDQRMAEPTNDFLSVLARGEGDGVFNRNQVLVNAALLLFAGHETTMNLICNGLLAFLRHPAQWARLVGDIDRYVRVATEECLRFDPPVKSTQRIAARDVELGDRQIRAGDRIRWMIAAANRDPAAFANPDDFDIGRQPTPHVSFGAGIHYCLGASLARIEGQEVLRAVAERMPGITLETEHLEYEPSIQFRSLRSLPVRWS